MDPLKLTPINRVKDEYPDWPFGSWWTGRLIREGKLGCVRIGRRVFVTKAILNAFIEVHQINAKNPA